MNTSYTYIGDAFLILNDLYGGAGLTFSPNSHTTASTARISTNRALSSSSSSSSSNRRSGGGDISMTRISIASSGMVGYLYTIIICMLYTMLYYVMICNSCYHRHHFIPIIALLYQLHHPFDRREDRISRSLQPLPIRTDDEVL